MTTTTTTDDGHQEEEQAMIFHPYYSSEHYLCLPIIVLMAMVLFVNHIADSNTPVPLRVLAALLLVLYPMLVAVHIPRKFQVLVVPNEEDEETKNNTNASASLSTFGGNVTVVVYFFVPGLRFTFSHVRGCYQERHDGHCFWCCSSKPNFNFMTSRDIRVVVERRRSQGEWNVVLSPHHPQAFVSAVQEAIDRAAAMTTTTTTTTTTTEATKTMTIGRKEEDVAVV